MNTARLIKQTRAPGAVQAVYELTPPYMENTHVVVSAVSGDGRLVKVPETYIFPCNEYGDVTSYADLPGSFRGDMDHARALTNAGYTIIEGDESNGS